MEKTSVLVDGRIPPLTDCPYAKRCAFKERGECHHTGEQHPVAFSCATARLFAMLDRDKK